MKKIITLTMIKNEADIVETFVRYTLNYAYKMYIIDNGSSDGTVEILKELQKEGLPIVLKEEANVFYEQFFIENKYMQEILRNEQFDFFIPADVDEFLGSDMDLTKELAQLDDGLISIVPWRTYCLTNECSGNNIFENIRCYRIDRGKVFTKVIIPYRLMRDEKLFLQMGHHDVEGIDGAKKCIVDSIFMGHFPVRSKEQIQLKIFQGILAQLMSGYHSVVAYQWRKLHKELREDGLNLIEHSAAYAVVEEIDYKDIELIEKPFDVTWCVKPIDRKYENMISRDVAKNVAYFAERIAIYSILPDAEKNKDGILIYGTGGTALHFVEYAGVSLMSDIICFIDSDGEREYERFFDKLILAPDKIRFLDYRCIVVASNYYSEIYNILRWHNVEDRKIMTVNVFLSSQIALEK